MSTATTSILSVFEGLSGVSELLPGFLEFLLQAGDLRLRLVQLRIDLGDDCAPALLQLLFLLLHVEKLVLQLRALLLHKVKLQGRLVQVVLQLSILLFQLMNPLLVLSK